MVVRVRYIAVVVIAVAVIAAAVAGKRLLRPDTSTETSIPSPATQAYLVILGINGKAVVSWDGSISATGTTILNVKGRRASDTDSFSGNTWKLTTRTAGGPVQETGVIVTTTASTFPVTFNVTTTQGNFTFSSADVRFGTSKKFLNGRALGAQTGAGLQLTSSNEEEDFPSMAQSGDDIYLAYTQFVHGDRGLAQALQVKQPITDFSFLARPAGGDQVFPLHYSKSQRVWTGPFPVTGPGEDIMRVAVAFDGQGRAWIFYSAQRAGDFDIYARSARADGAVSSEIRLTSDPGTDLFPVATTDPSGRVWVAWQGFRKNNLEVLASAQTERSIAYPEGHRNIVFAQRGIRPLPRLPLSAETPVAPAPDTNMLYSYLHFFNGISAPPTSATTQGTDWRNNDPQVEPFVEIYQGDRQDYEMPGAPRGNTPADSIAGYQPQGYVSAALGMGYQLGFEASSDHISTHIGFTNIWVTQPTRSAILDAMKKRRLYGATDNILADFRSGAHFMGESFTATSSPQFSVRLWGTAPFQTVVVVKDNNIVFTTSGDRVLSFTYQDTAAVKGKTSYYYVRGLQTDGQVVWVSPMWVTMQ